MTDRERDKKRVGLTERIAASSRAMKAIDERIAEFKVQRAAESADRARAHAQLAALSGELQEETGLGEAVHRGGPFGGGDEGRSYRQTGGGRWLRR